MESGCSSLHIVSTGNGADDAFDDGDGSHPCLLVCVRQPARPQVAAGSASTRALTAAAMSLEAALRVAHDAAQQRHEDAADLFTGAKARATVGAL